MPPPSALKWAMLTGMSEKLSHCPFTHVKSHDISMISQIPYLMDAHGCSPAGVFCESSFFLSGSEIMPFSYIASKIVFVAVGSLECNVCDLSIVHVLFLNLFTRILSRAWCKGIGVRPSDLALASGGFFSSLKVSCHVAVWMFTHLHMPSKGREQLCMTGHLQRVTIQNHAASS